MQPQIQIFPDRDSLNDAAAHALTDAARDAIAQRGKFGLALAGGSTPRGLYQRLAAAPYRNEIDWSHVHLFWGDERAVAPEDERSNFRMVRETLLDVVPIPPANVHRMPADADDLDAAARDYEATLRAFGNLDVVLLGMGDDGHTASLFPGSPQVGEGTRWCVATPVSPTSPPLPRLTLTFPAINTAREAWICVVGGDKSERLKQVFAGDDINELPIRGVRPQSGRVVWMLDKAAAEQLDGNK